jgi:hypothetical protein
MRKRQNKYVAWFIAFMHDEEQALTPAVIVMYNIAEWFRKLMTKPFVFCVKMCHTFPI